MRLKARGKINWTLDIVGQRPDGYHLMDMLMQPVTLADEVVITEADCLTLTTGGEPLLPADEHHLALRAARAMQTYTGTDRGAAIHVEKHIPVGAGMGGGSADAAAVILGLNKLWQLGLDAKALESIGLSLGADVPFCIRGGLQRTTGIGEIMETVGQGDGYPLCVVQPCDALSTGEVFRGYHAAQTIRHPDTDKAVEALQLRDIPMLRAASANVLAQVSVPRRPEIARAVEALYEAGALCAAMTGSGSAVFGVFTDDAAARSACEHLSTIWNKCWHCSTCSAGVVEE